MPSRLPYIVTAMLTLISSGSALAISDDANPWLAIENAVCVSHRAVDYSAALGAHVIVSDAQWLGATDGLPTHCFVSGQTGGDFFEIRLPINWNGKTYGADKTSEGSGVSSGHAALNEGFAVFYGHHTEGVTALLQAAVKHQYAAFETSN